MATGSVFLAYTWFFYMPEGTELGDMFAIRQRSANAGEVYTDADAEHVVNTLKGGPTKMYSMFYAALKAGFGVGPKVVHTADLKLEMTIVIQTASKDEDADNSKMLASGGLDDSDDEDASGDKKDKGVPKKHINGSKKVYAAYISKTLLTRILQKEYSTAIKPYDVIDKMKSVSRFAYDTAKNIMALHVMPQILSDLVTKLSFFYDMKPHTDDNDSRLVFYIPSAFGVIISPIVKAAVVHIAEIANTTVEVIASNPAAHSNFVYAATSHVILQFAYAKPDMNTDAFQKEHKGRVCSSIAALRKTLNIIVERPKRKSLLLE
jgi:hypothetical protein